MERIGGGRLDRRADAAVERRGILGFGVDQQAPDADALGHGCDLQERIGNQTRAETLALLFDIDAEPREDDDRQGVKANALREPARRVLVQDRPGGQSVKADHAPSARPAHDIDLGGPGLARLETVSPKPGRLGIGPTVEVVADVVRRQ